MSTTAGIFVPPDDQIANALGRAPVRRPLRTAAERAAEQEFTPPPPGPADPVKAPILCGLLLPTESEIQKAIAPGLNADATRFCLVTQREGNASLIRSVAVAAWQEIEADASESKRLRDRMLKTIADSAATIDMIRTTLLTRADLLERLEVMRVRLADTSAKLNDSALALALTAAEFAKLSNDLKLLPDLIAGSELEVEKLTADILAAASASRIDLAGLLAVMLAEARPPVGKTWANDDRLYHLFRNGFMDLGAPVPALPQAA